VKRSIIITLILSLLIWGLWFFINPSGASAQTPQATYIGVDKCKVCHPKNFEAFSGRKFKKAWKVLEMRAWKVLEMRGKTKDPECVRCHVTGYGEPGGFVDEESTPHLKYKQCESCHGPGSLHASNPINKEYRKIMAPYKYSDENICIRCHTCMWTHGTAKF
jgi:hypothetical protein